MEGDEMRYKYGYDYYINRFKQAKDDARKLFSGMDAETFNAAPAEGKWSPGQILSHLVEAGTRYYKSIKTGIYHAPHKYKHASEPFKLSFLMQKFVDFVSPEGKKAVPTVSAFEPVSKKHLNKDKILGDFLNLQDDLIALVQKAKNESMDLSKVKVQNPVLSFVRMDVNACLAITEAHQRRHLQKVKKLLGLEADIDYTPPI